MPRASRSSAQRAPAPRPLGAAALDAHPVPTLIADRKLQIVSANAAARRLLGAREGVLLGDALACIDARSEGGCGGSLRCASCAFRSAVRRALGGETVRERGFVLRGDAGDGGDLHLLATAGPLAHGDEPLAVLSLDDANAILGDPGIVRICEGCGRVKDEEGGWHPLHRYLEDRLGLEAPGPLCDDCASGHPERR